MGFVSATTRAARGLRYSMNGLVVPPLPAASRPSKRIRCLVPVSWAQYWNFSSSICSLYLIVFVDVPVEPLVVRVVLEPGLDRVAPGVDEVGVGQVLVVPDAVAAGEQLVQVLAEVLVHHTSLRRWLVRCRRSSWGTGSRSRVGERVHSPGLVCGAPLGGGFGFVDGAAVVEDLAA